MAAMTSLLLASLALSAAGTGVQMFGAMQQADISRQAEAQRKRAMELDARRRSMEAVRNMQRAQAMALTTATNQGAQFGSNLMGAEGQISGQTNTNLSGIQQNLEIGRNIFDLNSQMADAQFLSSMGKGMSSLGGSLFQAMPAFGRMEGGGWGQMSNIITGRDLSNWGWNRA